MKTQIAVALLWTLGAIFAAAALFIAVAWRGKPSKRIWMAWLFEALILAGVFVPAFLGGFWLLGAVAVLTWAGGTELYRTLAAGGRQPIVALGVAAMLAVVGVGHALPGLLPGLSVALLAVLLAMRAVSRRSSPETAVSRLTATLAGVVYPGLGLAHVVAMGEMEGGFGFIVLCYGLVEVNDSAAFLVGSALGKHQIFPKLSPNKTIEGNLGGIVATGVVAFALRFAVPGFDTAELLAGAILLAIAGQGGDLFASRIKRRAGVKDFGDAVPMHGGLLDVYDSFLFAAPLFYYFVRWLPV